MSIVDVEGSSGQTRNGKNDPKVKSDLYRMMLSWALSMQEAVVTLDAVPWSVVKIGPAGVWLA